MKREVMTFATIVGLSGLVTHLAPYVPSENKKTDYGPYTVDEVETMLRIWTVWPINGIRTF